MFLPEGDPQQFARAVWMFARWLVLGPLIGIVMLGGLGLILAGPEGAANGAVWGLVLGGSAGVMATGARVLSHWQT